MAFSEYMNFKTSNWINLQVRQRSLLYQFLWVVQVISSKNTRTGLVWLHWCSSQQPPNLFSFAPFFELIRTKVELFPNLASAFALTFFQQSFHSNHLWPLMWKDKKNNLFGGNIDRSVHKYGFEQIHMKVKIMYLENASF